jgi:hypothetical protein
MSSPGVFHCGSPGLGCAPPASGGAAVQPPTPTTQSVSAGGSPAAKTFSAFTDSDGLVASYSAAVVNAVGSASVSGSGLGAYTFSGTSDGGSFVLRLNALSSGGQILATAVHAVGIAAANATAQAPAATSETVASGDDPASYTFPSFTDTGSIIASYEASSVNVIGSTSLASGSGLGAYVFDDYEDGDSFVLALSAKDAGGNVIATAIRAITIKSSTGSVAGSGLAYIYHVASPVSVGVAGTLS